MSGSTASGGTDWEERARRAETHLAALDAAIQGISNVQRLDRVLQLIVERVRELADAEYAALGIADSEGVIEQFLTSGLSQAQRDRIGALPRGHGLLGLIIHEGQSFRLPEIAADPHSYGFPPNHPAMHSFLGVPIRVKGRPVGDLYLTNKRGAPEFSAADQQLVERFALHAGIAIENARLRERVQALAVIEERERIGRDLHDGVIQRIYGVTLALEDVSEMVASAPGEAAERVERAIDSLHATIEEIRNYILSLEPGQSPRDLLAAIEAIADQVRIGMPVEVAIDGVRLPDLPDAVQDQVLNVVREALSNVARHAQANQVSVRLRADGAELALEVADDGVGLNADAGTAPGHHGLANMRRRAEQLGGELEVLSGDKSGTRIILRVPLIRDTGRQ
jgi:signal transduction histidine kinase